MSINIGIVGAGAIGCEHGKAAREVGLTVAGITDTNHSVAESFAADLGHVSVFQDTEALFASPKIDAVVICVPNVYHKDLAINAMRAGKDVLLEKPMGMNANECRQINKVAEETGRILQIGFVQRYSTVGYAAKQIMDAGVLGNIYHVKAQVSRRRGIPGLGGWFTNKAWSGGGPLIDLGVHVIDLALYLLDYPIPTRVTGMTYANFGRPIENYVYETMWAGPPQSDGVFDVEDDARAMIHFNNGTTFSIEAAWAINAPERSQPESMVGIFGDKGGMTFELFGDRLNLATEVCRYNADSMLYLPEKKMYEEQIADYARVIKQRGCPLATGKQGEVVQSIIDAVYESSHRHQEVHITRDQKSDGFDSET